MSPTPVSMSSQSLEQENPVANSPHPYYAPPSTPNFATAPKRPSFSKKVDPVCMTSPPIYNSRIATEVYDCTMDTYVTLTPANVLVCQPV